jgi:hypothetical protein
MTKGTMILSLICLAAFCIVALSATSYRDRTDRYRVESAHAAIHGNVIQPYRD